METIGIVVAVIVGIIAIATVLLQKKSASSSKFYARRPLTEPEQALFWKLRNALPDHAILPQVAFSRFVYTKGATKKENFRYMATAKQKVADFLICDKTFFIIAVIELDDSSHNTTKDAARDAILKEAGLRVLRWKVNTIPTENEIRSILAAKN